jgi:hypothetical protein
MLIRPECPKERGTVHVCKQSAVFVNKHVRKNFKKGLDGYRWVVILFFCL